MHARNVSIWWIAVAGSSICASTAVPHRHSRYLVEVGSKREWHGENLFLTVPEAGTEWRPRAKNYVDEKDIEDSLVLVYRRPYRTVTYGHIDRVHRSPGAGFRGSSQSQPPNIRSPATSNTASDISRFRRDALSVFSSPSFRFVSLDSSPS